MLIPHGAVENPGKHIFIPKQDQVSEEIGCDLAACKTSRYNSRNVFKSSCNKQCKKLMLRILTSNNMQRFRRLLAEISENDKMFWANVTETAASLMQTWTLIYILYNKVLSYQFWAENVWIAIQVIFS